jgi:hypothetical protein
MYTNHGLRADRRQPRAAQAQPARWPRRGREAATKKGDTPEGISWMNEMAAILKFQLMML